MSSIELGIVRSKAGTMLCLVVFLAAITWPLPGLLLWNETEIIEQEKRNPNAFPDWPVLPDQIAKWPQQFEAWINDRLLFRTGFVFANTAIQLKVFGRSTSNRVVLGRDGWLFYSSDRSIEQALGKVRFTAEELDRWIDVMERRQAWLAERSIPFLAVVVPNKERVYREYLPTQPDTPNPISYLDQVKQRLAERRSPLNLLDLTPGLLAGKASMLVYRKSDTHWTGQAAFMLGYLPIMERLNAMGIKFKYLSAADVPPQPTPLGGGDLAGLLGTPSLYPETIVEMPVPPPGHLESINHREENGRITTFIVSTLTGTPRVVLFHDSFSVKLLAYLHETFRLTVAREHKGMHFDRGVVEFARPHVVIYQFVERALWEPIPPE
jgi:alginate O-acetyltransferase complex protein AlgJ